MTVGKPEQALPDVTFLLQNRSHDNTAAGQARLQAIQIGSCVFFVELIEFHHEIIGLRIIQASRDDFGFGDYMSKKQFGAMLARNAHRKRQHALGSPRSVEGNDKPPINNVLLLLLPVRGDQQERGVGAIEHHLGGSAQREVICRMPVLQSAPSRHSNQIVGVFAGPAGDFLASDAVEQKLVLQNKRPVFGFHDARQIVLCLAHLDLPSDRVAGAEFGGPALQNMSRFHRNVETAGHSNGMTEHMGRVAGVVQACNGAPEGGCVAIAVLITGAGIGVVFPEFGTGSCERRLNRRRLRMHFWVLPNQGRPPKFPISIRRPFRIDQDQLGSRFFSRNPRFVRRPRTSETGAICKIIQLFPIKNFD